MEIIQRANWSSSLAPDLRIPGEEKPEIPDKIVDKMVNT